MQAPRLLCVDIILNPFEYWNKIFILNCCHHKQYNTGIDAYWSKQGLWNRTVLAGVAIMKILLAELAVHHLYCHHFLLEFIFYSELVCKSRNFESSPKHFMLLTGFGRGGKFWGSLLSSIWLKIKSYKYCHKNGWLILCCRCRCSKELAVGVEVTIRSCSA